VVMLKTCVLEVCGLNLSRVTGYCDISEVCGSDLSLLFFMIFISFSR
jgi:hypothetical protein